MLRENRENYWKVEGQRKRPFTHISTIKRSIFIFMDLYERKKFYGGGLDFSSCYKK
jgi:hypothetical protein